MKFPEYGSDKFMELMVDVKNSLNLGVNKLYSVPYINLPIKLVISGGAIPDIIHGNTPNDYDMYFKLKNDLDKFIHASKNEIKDNVIPSNNDYEQNAIMLKGNVHIVTIDIAMNCIPKFDFVHCMPYYDIATNIIYISEQQYHLITTKTLVLNCADSYKDKSLAQY